MSFNEKEINALISLVKQYRAWLYQTVKESGDEMGSTVKAYFAIQLQEYTDLQQKLDDALASESDDNVASTENEKVNREDIIALVADDDDISADLMVSMLEDSGITKVETVNDGHEALELIKTKHFDLIISDWRMPKLNGLDLHKQLQENNLLKSSTFVLLTAINDDVLAERAKKQGINKYLVKPLDIDAFTELVEALF